MPRYDTIPSQHQHPKHPKHVLQSLKAFARPFLKPCGSCWKMVVFWRNQLLAFRLWGSNHWKQHNDFRKFDHLPTSSLASLWESSILIHFAGLCSDPSSVPCQSCQSWNESDHFKHRKRGHRFVSSWLLALWRVRALLVQDVGCLSVFSTVFSCTKSPPESPESPASRAFLRSQ